MFFFYLRFNFLASTCLHFLFLRNRNYFPFALCISDYVTANIPFFAVLSSSNSIYSPVTTKPRNVIHSESQNQKYFRLFAYPLLKLRPILIVPVILANVHKANGCTFALWPALGSVCRSFSQSAEDQLNCGSSGEKKSNLLLGRIIIIIILIILF